MTGIRFFAAAYVVLFHSRLAAVMAARGWTAAGNFFLSGYLAVPLFFILSGFILAYTYNGQIRHKGDHQRYFEARFARIWPLYALSLLLASLVNLRVPSPGVMVATALMLQSWNPFNLEMAGSWNAVCWTLSCELLFYLCFPWLQTWLERGHRRLPLVLLAGSVLLCVGTNSGSRTLWYTAHGVYRFIPLAVVHVPEFLVGVGLGNYFLERQRLPESASSRFGQGWLTYISTLVILALLCRPASFWTSLVIPAFAVLVYGLAEERTLLSRVLSSRLMTLCGGMSYAMYLMQNVVKPWVAEGMNRLHIDSVSLRLAVNMAVLLALSYVLFTAVENPVRKLLRGMFARMEGRRDLRQPDPAR
ncbi:acyltransferase family protein [Granulicella tundricola]|uniref:acyltransferase family protein n=1 Tax=Granulicella tundricola TaxID=940615 RepID=UPI0038CC1413